MGWNSWDCYGPTVTEAEVKANADYMAAYLKEYGWEYIVVDIRWYVDNDKAHGYNQVDPVYNLDECGRYLPSTVRFPSSAGGKGFKPLADYIHGKGLKFGIHIMRGVPVLAVKNDLPILGSTLRASAIHSPDSQCIWLRDNYTILAGKEGAQEYYNSIFDLYASWGVDYIKVDDLSSPYHGSEIEMIRKAIDQTGRKIVFSTSPGPTPIEKAAHIKSQANLWRLTGDFWDNWSELKDHFEICHQWSPWVGNGNWPDADMLPLGRIGIRAENGDDRLSRLTQDEQTCLMTLFAIFRAPLMFGGDLPSNDPFTLSLLTNKEVLAVNQHSINNHQLYRENNQVAWMADDPGTGDRFLALFNAEDPGPILEKDALWSSGVLDSLHQVTDINLDLKNARSLYLVVTDAGDGYSWDHADWVEPIVKGPRGIIRLTSLPWTKATAGWGEVSLNHTVLNQPLVLDGKEYTDGIGTHSPSIIQFDLPDGITHFTARAGLDKECVGQPGATMKFMIFTRDPTGTPPPDSVRMTVTFEQMGLTGPCLVRDQWRKKDLGVFENELSTIVPRHGAVLYRIKQR
jgi:alpha-galactosidase